MKADFHVYMSYFLRTSIVACGASAWVQSAQESIECSDPDQDVPQTLTLKNIYFKYAISECVFLL
jgi:hypothetical protein